MDRFDWFAVSLLALASGCKARGVRDAGASPPSSDAAGANDIDDALVVDASAPPSPVVPEAVEPATTPSVATDGLPGDDAFAGTDSITIPRATFRIRLPDEAPALEIERTIRIDDQGDRAVVTVFGNGLPLLPGTRITARNGFVGLMIVSPDGTHYRVVSPDQVQHWFLGNSSRAGTVLQFHRTDNTVVATRGGLSLVLNTPATGDRHPLACRLFIALVLGGDPAAARIGCSEARLPTRGMVRARGWAAISFERTALDNEAVTRRSLAFPPEHGTADYEIPAHAADGRFYTDAELGTLPGRHGSRRTLRVRNGLSRESLLFLDDLALGWFAPGSSLEFGNLTDGLHHVRIRSLDGLERSRNLPANLPAEFDFDLDPNLR